MLQVSYRRPAKHGENDRKGNAVSCKFKVDGKILENCAGAVEVLLIRNSSCTRNLDSSNNCLEF